MISKQKVILICFVLTVFLVAIRLMLLLRGIFSILKELSCLCWTSTTYDKLQPFTQLIIIFLHFNKCLLQLFVKMYYFVNTSTVDGIIKRYILIRKQIELLYLVLIIIVQCLGTVGVWTDYAIYLAAVKSHVIWRGGGEHGVIRRCI